MIAGIKAMIERCIERMRGGACANCDNRAYCPAGRWQQAFGSRGDAPRSASRSVSILSLLGGLTGSGARTRGFRREVERAIEPLLPSGEANIDRVARELGVSRQTLYRRLKAEGATFEEALDEMRRRLALRYLERERISVKAAAYRLGFSDPAAFSRAFKRWTGSSPSSFRAAPAG